MKLFSRAVLFCALLGLTGLASADPVDPYAPRGQIQPQPRGQLRAERRQQRQLRRQRRIQKIINKYDLNHDGIVDQGELPPRLARRLAKLDRNGDGWIDQADMQPRARRER